MSNPYDIIESLDEEKLSYLQEQLLGSGDLAYLASQVKDSWGLFEGVPDDVVALFLGKYRGDLKAHAQASGVVVEPDIDPIKEMKRLALIQKGRVDKVLEAEKGQPIPSTAGHDAIESYQETLLTLQKMTGSGGGMKKGGKDIEGDLMAVIRAANRVANSEEDF